MTYLSEIIGPSDFDRKKNDVTYSERGNLQGNQFHAVAGLVYEKAVARDIGSEIPTEWFLQNIRN